MIFERNSAITAFDFAPRFQGSGLTFALHQFGSTTNHTTTSGAAVSPSAVLVVADASAFSVGDYLTPSGGTGRARVKTKGGNTLELDNALTWSNGANVAKYAIGAGSVPGLSLSSAGLLTGTPTNNGTTTDLFVRATAGDGTNVDSSVFQITITDPPLPVTFTGFLSDQNYVVGQAIPTIATGAQFANETAYNVTETGLPPGLSLNTSTGDITGTPTVVGTYLCRVEATGSGDPDQSNYFTLTIVAEQSYGLTIPDFGEGLHPAQSVAFEEDITTIVLGASGTHGVLFGCLVTAQAPPSMTLDVSRGGVLSSGNLVPVPETTVTLTDPDAGMHRTDLIVVSSEGIVDVRPGLAVSIGGTDAPKPGAREPGDVALAMVYVPDGATSVTTLYRYDKRLLRTQGPLLIDKVYTPLVINDSAEEQVLYAKVIPAALMGQGRAIRFRTGGTLLLNDGSPTVKFEFLYGNTSLFADISGAATADTDRVVWTADVIVVAQSGAQQVLMGHLAISTLGSKTAPTSGQGDAFDSSGGARPIYGKTFVDSTTENQIFELRATLSVPSPSNEITREFATAELI
jgi:hypothetical protein